MRLINMSDYVIDKTKSGLNDASSLCVDFYNYANFLKQPLNLGMFVPCDEDGNALKVPKFIYLQEDLLNLDGVELEVALILNKKASDYGKAKERVLFEGFEYFEFDGGYLVRNSFCKVYDFQIKNLTIEDLNKQFININIKDGKQF